MDLTQQSADFFQQLMSTIPNQYKQTDQPQEEDAPMKLSKNQKKKLKQAQNQNLSILELKERAQARIDSIQKQNREKSLQKIKELTKQHQENGGGIKKDKKKPKGDSADVQMAFDDLSADETTANPTKPKEGAEK